MPKRLLPFRQYAEEDVINMYALEDTYVNENVTGDGGNYGDNGVFVSISSANFDDDLVTYATDNYLGKTDYPHVYAQFPKVTHKVQPAHAGQNLPVLGVTLRETADYDENGEKLLYYPQKALETYTVIRGQAVPVLTRGVVTLAETAFDNVADGGMVVGNGVVISSATSGQVSGVAYDATAQSDGTLLGNIIATGSRNNGDTPTVTDQFSGAYAVVHLR